MPRPTTGLPPRGETEGGHDHGARLALAPRLAERLARRARTGEILLRKGQVEAALRCVEEVSAVARALGSVAPRGAANATPGAAPDRPGVGRPASEPPFAPVPLRRLHHAAPRPPIVAAPGATDEAWDRANQPTERVLLAGLGPPDAAPESLGPAPDFAPGSLVADRYHIEAKIGAGGMSAVYRAHDEELGEVVALKLFSLRTHDDGLLLRFKQELCVSRRLSHPNVVHLYDIGTFEGQKFLTMELLEGRSLRDLLDHAGHFDPRRAIRVLVQVCAGLDTAHRAGIVHRDVKPENLFVTSEGIVKVMDFGIAKRTSSEADPATAGWVVGTPTYMAPEQLASFDDVSPLADVYSLGVVAFELLAGVPPFLAATPLELLLRHMTEPPPSLRARDDSTPVGLDDLVRSLLAKDPARRPQSCAEVAARLLGVLADLG